MFNLKIYDEGFIYCGSEIATKSHAHYAIAVAIAAAKPFEILSDQPIISSRLAIIPPNYAHEFKSIHKDKITLIYIEPTSLFSANIKTQFQLEKEVLKLDHLYDSLQPYFIAFFKNEDWTASLLTDFLLQLLPQKPLALPIESRILQSIQIIQAQIEHPIKIATIATGVHLSESRFTHLFKDEIGISCIKFIRWTRLKNAAKLIIKGYSMTDACYESGFTDLAHFNRVFKEMFGLSPSKAIK